MKKIILLLLLVNFSEAKINIVVSILPQKVFVKEIGKELVSVEVMVNGSPHSYEPKPSQMKSLLNASIYFAMGVEFENIWLGKFYDVNPKLDIVDLSNGVLKFNNDPHIWTTPLNISTIAKNIYETLRRKDPKNIGFYKENYEDFLEKLADVHKRVQKIVSKSSKKKFMVFHPSWEYVALTYGLEQIAIEVNGKEPKPKTLISILKKAKKEKVSALFTQPEFSDKSAKLIAKSLNIPVVKLSPLSPYWDRNLITIANSLK